MVQSVCRFTFAPAQAEAIRLATIRMRIHDKLAITAYKTLQRWNHEDTRAITGKDHDDMITTHQYAINGFECLIPVSTISHARGTEILMQNFTTCLSRVGESTHTPLHPSLNRFSTESVKTTKTGSLQNNALCMSKPQTNDFHSAKCRSQ